MVRDLLKIYIPLFIVISFICGLFYFFYPIIRYEYQQRTNDRDLVRIDRFTGETSELIRSQGWKVIESTIPK